MTHTYEGRLPLFFQSNFLGKAATPSRGLCHQSHVAWQQNDPKLDRCVCVHALLRPSESQTQSQLGSPIPGPSSSQAELLERWSFGKEDKVPGIPSGNLGFSFQSTSCAKKPAKLQNATYPPRVARRWIWMEGALLQTGSRPLPQEQCSVEPSKCQRGIKGWEPLRQKQNLCAAKSTVEKKIIFSKTP